MLFLDQFKTYVVHENFLNESETTLQTKDTNHTIRSIKFFLHFVMYRDNFHTWTW